MRRRCGGKKVYYQNEFDRQTNHTVQYALFVPKRLFWGHFMKYPNKKGVTQVTVFAHQALLRLPSFSPSYLYFFKFFFSKRPPDPFMISRIPMNNIRVTIPIIMHLSSVEGYHRSGSPPLMWLHRSKHAIPHQVFEITTIASFPANVASVS